MKIGIVTFWQTRDNYGQMLQCWALQHYLRSCGHEPYLIRYRHTEAFAIDFKITVKGFIKNLLRLRLKSLLPKKTILPPLSNNDKQRDFETFKKEKLQVSERTYLSLQELQKEPPEADCYIVGSDQVWSKLIVIFTYGIPLPFVSGANLKTKNPEISPPRVVIKGKIKAFCQVENAFKNF